MTVYGVNSDAHGTYGADLLAELGAGWVRVVAYRDVDLRAWLEGCRARGIKVLLVLAKESFWDVAEQTWSDSIGRYLARYGDLIDAWQLGNEADQESVSSWTLTALELTVLLRAARRVLGPERYLVGPGLVSGQPDYLLRVDLGPVDAIAVHPYGRRPDDALVWRDVPGNFGRIDELVERYRKFNKPIWLTEWGVTLEQVSPAFQWQYTAGVLEWIGRQNNLGPTFQFCLHPYQGWGLLLPGDVRTSAFRAFQRISRRQQPPVEAEPVSIKAPVVGDGVLKRMAELGDSPATDEVYFPQGEAAQWSVTYGRSGGEYVYLFATNEVLVFSPSSSAA